MIDILCDDLLNEIIKYLVVKRCFVFGIVSKRFYKFYHSNIFRKTIISKIKSVKYNLIDFTISQIKYNLIDFTISQINYLYQKSLYDHNPSVGIKNKVNLNGEIYTLTYDGKVTTGSRGMCIAEEIKSIIPIGRYPIFLTQAGTLINYQNADIPYSYHFDDVKDMTDIIQMEIINGDIYILQKNGKVTMPNEYGYLDINDNLPYIIEIVNLASSPFVLTANGELFSANDQTFRLYDILQVCSTDLYALFLRRDGKVYVSGSCKNGRMGLGADKTMCIIPTIIPDLENIRQIATGKDKSLFLNKNGDVYACGKGFRGYHLTYNCFKPYSYIYTPCKLLDHKHITKISKLGYLWTNPTSPTSHSCLEILPIIDVTHMNDFY